MDVVNCLEQDKRKENNNLASQNKIHLMSKLLMIVSFSVERMDGNVLEQHSQEHLSMDFCLFLLCFEAYLALTTN